MVNHCENLQSVKNPTCCGMSADYVRYAGISQIPESVQDRLDSSRSDKRPKLERNQLRRTRGMQQGFRH